MELELTIQQVSEATGLTAHTLRYYERAGLLPRVDRNGGGHRRYHPLAIDSLLFLTRLRSTGMPIHQVRRYAELAREGVHTIPERKALLEAHRETVLSHIAELNRNLAALDYKIGLYEQGWVPENGIDDPCLRELRRLCGATEEEE
ncbi:MerR family transcriptional regulator [Fimbriimonas ginsengisoli]|uniref:Transcriptional regulator, MerR family n=1 Tax=Fimbriimonas ginsengisoli Gsoil 348 TaxID=661478 RepID=A0A068NTZ5_FIMGI|nr:MerR family transcriptional regulator [Fimbriimonas ginsengisoli]AIE86245.1 transcriptional regulator, MerR family [Fimbriimonas ginsengisoli Gsoil 348]